MTLVWCVVGVSWLLALFITRLPQSLQGDDDNLYLYTTGLAVGRPAEVNRLNREVATFMRNEGYGSHARFRWDQRHRYEYNYLLPSAVLYGTSRVVATRPHPSYSDFLLSALPAGFLVTYLLILIVLGTGVLATRSRLVVVSVAAAILLSCAVDSLIGYRAPYRVIIPGDPLATLQAGAGALLRPSGALGIFSHTPRNLAAVLMFLVFAWRLNGWHAASYWVLVGLSTIHQGLAGLVLASLAGVDLILRPRTLLRSHAAIPAVLAAILFLTRDRLLFRFLDAGWVIGAMVALIAAGGLAGWWYLRGGRGAKRQGEARLQSTSMAAAEGGMLLLQAGACLVVAYLMDSRAERFTALYFWDELPGRFEAMIRPGLMLLACYVAISYASTAAWTGTVVRRMGRSAALAVGLFLIAGAGLRMRHGIPAEFPRFRSGLAGIESAYAEFGIKPPADDQENLLQIQEREAVLFRALGETVDLGNGALDSLLRRGRER